MGPRSVSLLMLGGAAWLAACGLSTMGDAPVTADAGPDGNVGAPPDARGPDGRGADEGGREAQADAPGPDSPSDGAAQPDAPLPTDAPAGDGWSCAPVDAGIVGALDLSKFTLAGNAQWNEYNDGKLTLTDSYTYQAGAGWAPTQMPKVTGYDLTWSFRVGPGDTAGEGITFAVVAKDGQPDNTWVGNNGSDLGLNGFPGTGYAVAIDMYNTNELRLVTMPSYQTVVAKSNGDKLNDGNIHSVDVSWRAPSTLIATLHSTSGDLTVVSSDAGLTAPGAAWFGFTGATGGLTDSHQEIASLVVHDMCQ